MPPVDCIGLYNDVGEILAHSKHSGSAPNWAMQLAVSNAIRTAVTNGLTTCTTNCSSYPQAIIVTEMGTLSAMGYKTSYSGSTLTVSWPL